LLAALKKGALRTYPESDQFDQFRAARCHRGVLRIELIVEHRGRCRPSCVQPLRRSAHRSDQRDFAFVATT
jgi:hypothetical protein